MRLSLEKEVLEAINLPMKEDSCFVCGCGLNAENRTREHVLPQWVLQRFGLTNSQLVLLNGTTIPYRQLTVPCCKYCNGKHLSQLEIKIREAVCGGYSGVLAVPEGFLYQWMAKLYVGFLYKELFLPADRREPLIGSIMQPEELRNVRILWFWLRQSLTHDNAIRAPGSVWVFRCLVPPKELGEAFDLLDYYHTPMLGIRMGDIGVVADFLDCGLLKQEMLPITQDLQRLRLAPEQFAEVFVRLAYKASTFGLHTDVRVGCSDAGDEVLGLFPQSTIQDGNTFRPWDEEDYAHLLEVYAHVAPNSLMRPAGKAHSWIYGEGDQIKQYNYR